MTPPKKSARSIDPEHEEILKAIQGLTRTVLEGQKMAREAHGADERSLKLALEKLDELTQGHEAIDRRVTALEDWRKRRDRESIPAEPKEDP